MLARTAGISLRCNPLCMGQAWVLEYNVGTHPNTRYFPLFGPNRKNRFTRLAKMARARSLAAI